MGKVNFFKEEFCSHGMTHEHYIVQFGALHGIPYQDNHCKGGTREKVLLNIHGAMTTLGEVKNDDPEQAVKEILSIALGVSAEDVKALPEETEQ